MGADPGPLLLSVSRLTPVCLSPARFLLSPQHHLCLHGVDNHGHAAHQYRRGGGAHVFCPGAGLVQCHVFCPRIPDARPLHHHDPEGQCLPLSYLEKGPRPRITYIYKVFLHCKYFRLCEPHMVFAIFTLFFLTCKQSYENVEIILSSMAISKQAYRLGL